MNIEKLLDTCYKVYLTGQDEYRLQIIADTFYHGNISAALSEIFNEGLELSEAVKRLLEDTVHAEEITQRYCELELDKVHRKWKGEDDGHKSNNDE